MKSPLSSRRPAPSSARDAGLAQPVELVDRPHDDAAAVRVALRVVGVEHARDLHDAVQHLAVVDADRVVAARDAGGLQRLAEHRADLGVGGDRGGADGVGVALVELAEAARARLLVAPDRADLVAAVGGRQAQAVLGEDAGERRGQVVAQRQPLLVLVLPGEDALVRAVDVGEELAERLDGLDGAGLQRVEAVGVVDLADPVEHRGARPDLGAEVVAEALRGLRPRAAGLLRFVLGHVGGPQQHPGALLAQRAARGQVSRARSSGRGDREAAAGRPGPAAAPRRRRSGGRRPRSRPRAGTRSGRVQPARSGAPPRPGVKSTPAKPSPPGSAKLSARSLLAGAQHVDGEMRGRLERREAPRLAGRRPEHQRRLERDAGEAVGGDPERAVGGHRRDHGHAGGEAAERVAQLSLGEVGQGSPRVQRRDSDRAAPGVDARAKVRAIRPEAERVHTVCRHIMSLILNDFVRRC